MKLEAKLVFISVALYSVAGYALQPSSAVRERALSQIVSAPVPLRDGIGVVSITTAPPPQNAFYNQGVAYLHSFVWIEAARSFNQALRLDPNLAMAYVGLSYALGELGMSPEARNASDRAQLLAASVSPREKVKIDLRKQQLDAAALPNDTALRAAYRKTLDAALAAYPDDVELWLLVGQAQDPSRDGHGMNVGSSSLPFYLQALSRSPDYFATHHLLTHAYENTGQFDQALVHAERYARLAYAVPHAHHMYGHVLRRLNRMKEAIVEFERADQLEAAYLQSEAIPPQYDWHYRHNLSLLGASYQYAGRMASADAVLRRAFELDGATPTEFDPDRKQWVMSLLARGRPVEALAAAQFLAARAQPLVQALGHLLASRALLALKRPDDAAKEGNVALGQMRSAGSSGGVLLPEFELTQGEFLLRTGQLDSGRTMLRGAAAKLQSASGPDAWVMTLFSLEAIVATARDLDDWPLVRYVADQMRELDPAYPGTQYVLGLLAEHDGDRDTALARYQEAVRGWADADPDFAGRLDARGRITTLQYQAAGSQSASGLPMPRYHHIHLNSVNPDQSLEWYAKYWPAGRRTTVAGFPAFQGGDLYLLYTKVAKQAPGAFDKTLHRSVPQSAFWTFGSGVVDTAGLVERLTKIDPRRYEFLRVYSSPEDKTGVIRSALAPQGDQLLTVSQLRERAEREKNAPPAQRPGNQDFGYLVDPDGMLVEFNSASQDHFWSHNHFWHEQPLCAANWYVEHLGMQLPPVRDPKSGEMMAHERWDPCEVPIGEVGYPSFMPQGQLRIPIGNVRFVNGSWAAYTRQCRNGRCGPGLDQPLSPSHGQVVDHVALTFPDLNIVMAHLKSTNVPIVRGPYRFGDTRAIMIEDPDGLGIELIEMK